MALEFPGCLSGSESIGSILRTSTGLMNSQLLTKLKQKAEKALACNTRFHNYGHALEVLDNVQKILQFENGDKDVLFAAALFHDLSNESGEQEGEHGANIARHILDNTTNFPKNKINDVCRLIKSISEDAIERDEVVINEADRMAIFSKLSIIRGFMIYAQRGVQPREAIEDFLAFIERKYQTFKIVKAKELVTDDYLFIKKFLIDSLMFYSQST